LAGNFPSWLIFGRGVQRPDDLDFDLLTADVTRGTDNLPANFDVSEFSLSSYGQIASD